MNFGAGAFSRPSGDSTPSNLRYKKKRRNVRRLGTSVPKFGTSDGEQSRRFEMFITMFGRKVAFWDKGCEQLGKKLYRICSVLSYWSCSVQPVVGRESPMEMEAKQVTMTQ